MWKCFYCGGQNPEEAYCCVHCPAPRTLAEVAEEPEEDWGRPYYLKPPLEPIVDSPYFFKGGTSVHAPTYNYIDFGTRHSPDFFSETVIEEAPIHNYRSPWKRIREFLSR